jgi:tRNA(Ile)-lysidine synthase
LPEHNQQALSVNIDLKATVGKFVARRGLVLLGDRVLVAVSGGPDSAALLHLLHELREELGLRLEVAHLQHGIRGDEAREDARFVAALAEQLGLPFHLKEIDLPTMKTKAGKGNLEELARAERYRFFADVVRERKLDKVATAHTRNDQAETVLMWMLRGAGMKGLGGIEPLHLIKPNPSDGSESLTVVRPLIEVSKAEILEFLHERNLSYRVDRTNQDPALLRNWIRLDLLPSLQGRTGANIAERLSRQATLIRDEDRLLDQLAQQRYDAMGGAKGLDRRMLLREPKALQRRVLRLWIEQMRGHLRGLDFVHVEELLRLIESKTPQGRISIPGGWDFVREYEALRLAKRAPGFKRLCYSYDLSIGQDLRIPEAGVQLLSERVEAPAGPWPAEPTEVVFDIGVLTESLLVRNFRRGDRIRPLGMTGHKKVKDLYIDNKIPLSVRANWPLLAMGREILWIPGYARSELGRVSEKTRSLLRIRLVSIGA